MTEGGLSQERFGAIRYAMILGRDIQKDHPEIALMYRGGQAIREISELLDISSKYNCSCHVANKAVQFALVGHKRGFGQDPYSGLIPDEEEKSSIEIDHKAKNGRSLGNKMLAEGRGAFSLTSGELSKAGKKGGKIGGKIGGANSYKNKSGYHGRTRQQMSRDGRMGGKIGGRYIHENKIGIHSKTREELVEQGRNSAISRGFVPWVRKGDKLEEDVYCAIDEVIFAHNLSLREEFKHGSGLNKGRVNNMLIAKELNIRYHRHNEVRNHKTVSGKLRDYRNSLEDELK